MKPSPPTRLRPEKTPPCVEVMILWGESVLHTKHLSPPRSFYVGNPSPGDRRGSRSFFPLHAPGLGKTRVPIVLANEAGAVTLVVPKGAEGWIEIAGRRRQRIQEIVDGDETVPCAELPSARQLAFPLGSKAAVDAFGVTFLLSLGETPRSAVDPDHSDRAGFPAIIGSTVLQLGLLASFAVAPWAAAFEDLEAERMASFKVLVDDAAQECIENPEGLSGNHRSEPCKAKDSPSALQSEVAPIRGDRRGSRFREPIVLETHPEGRALELGVGSVETVDPPPHLGLPEPVDELLGDPLFARETSRMVERSARSARTFTPRERQLLAPILQTCLR